jgi:hypothetical protein
MKPNNKTETPAALAAAALINAAHSLQIEPTDGCSVADLRIEGNAETLATLPAGCLYVLTFETSKLAAAVVKAAMRDDWAKGFIPFVASGSGRFRRQWIAGLIDLERNGISDFSDSQLICEIGRRPSVLSLCFMPDDLAAYWECDETGATHAGSKVPTGPAWEACRRAFERWQDHGAVTDAMECMRDAWNAAEREGGCK